MPVWGVVTAAAAPILLVAGWTIAARLQRGGFDPVTETISHLAGGDASHRWVMTTAILGTGICQIATAVGLRPAALPGRLVFATGGLCTPGSPGRPGQLDLSTAHGRNPSVDVSEALPTPAG
jgi:hypothetical membrane protein